MNKSLAEFDVNIVKVQYGKSDKGREFAVVEGLSGQLGIFKVYCTPEVGRTAEELIGVPSTMFIEVYADYKFNVKARVFTFE